VCEIKADVVGQDETETGCRAILNFGHTNGHAIDIFRGLWKIFAWGSDYRWASSRGHHSDAALGLGPLMVQRIQVIFSKRGLPTQIR